MMELNFARTVWADRQLAKLCPGNNIQRMGEILGTDDFDRQLDAIMKMIIIMNEAYERRAHFEDPTHEINVVSEEYLENLTEEELMKLSNEAFAQFGIDGEVTVEAEPSKKEEVPESN